MAKKIVRGITDVKTITNQDYDTNNVNDLLSDGQYNYIHRKKGETEEYHNLTDNIKTISSDNTELLTVTNNNKTTNTATLHPKHDAQKEQVLESTRDTITINHGTNGTAEKTTVDTNPQKVLEHENLLTGYGLRKVTSNNQTTITMDTPSLPDGFDLNNFNSGLARASYFTNAPYDNTPFYVVALGSVAFSVYQIAFKRLNSIDDINQVFLRTKMVGNNNWTEWKQYGTDNDTLNTMLADKQDKLTAGEGITIEGQTVDTNPQKVLEHENLLTINGISKTTTENVTTIGLKIIDNYSGDLNELTDTCLVKPTSDADNLPAIYDGILTVVKIGDIVSQKYHSPSNEVCTRVGEYFEGVWAWSEWIRASGPTSS